MPAQILLGILAQESNLWQASPHAVDASTGNPLTSLGFYGIESSSNPDLRAINWSNVDCGYGAAQVTTGMRTADTGQVVNGIVMDYTKQKAVAMDYAVNISAGLRLLQEKWNSTRAAGLIVNNGDPRYLENWWFAIWAYNTGLHPQNGSQPWGVGWSNNPANQDYPADRQMYLTEPLDVPKEGIDDEIGYDNAKHPNHWSYPERVIGFGYISLIRFSYRDRAWTSTYAPALTVGANKYFAQPGRFQFCSPAVNECDPAAQHVPADYPGTKPGACLRDDLKCWWHGPATWADCAVICGQEQLRYTTVEPRPFAEPGDNVHPTPVNPDGTCLVSGLPSNARIIDDINTSAALGAEGCRPTFTKGGTLSWKFGSMTEVQGATIYPSKVDFHQIGAGFGGHFWFAHTMMPSDGGVSNDALKVTGTWNINPTRKWTRIFVHVPDHGAHTRQADYKIYLPGQSTSNHHRAIPTRLEANTWVDIGVFDFRAAGTPRVELSNFTHDGQYVHDIAWDAIAVEPLGVRPRHFVAALGDSFSSGEGIGTYSRVSNQYGDDALNRNACHRSTLSWQGKLVIPNAPQGKGLADLAAEHFTNVDYHQLACSGARTHNVMATRTLIGAPAPANASGSAPAGQWGELTQLDQGFVDENTTLVVLSIGGNDANWTDVMKACALEDCMTPGFIIPGDTAPLTQSVPDRIRNKVKPDVQRVLSEVRQRAPFAWIILVGYPQLFKPNTSYDVNLLPELDIGITEEEVDWLNSMAQLAATEVLVSDLPNKLNSIDVRQDFVGHELGTLDLTENWLNGPVAGDLFYLTDDDGEPSDQPLAAESFHPNLSGHNAYAAIVGGRLSALGYVW